MLEHFQQALVFVVEAGLVAVEEREGAVGFGEGFESGGEEKRAVDFGVPLFDVFGSIHHRLF